ncbi:hypothetical protein ACSBR1_034389 [Camellia fascicularis]
MVSSKLKELKVKPQWTLRMITLQKVARHQIKARGVDLSSRFVKPAVVPHNQVSNLHESRLFG